MEIYHFRFFFFFFWNEKSFVASIKIIHMELKIKVWVLKVFRLVLAAMESRDGYNKGVASSPGVTSAVIICEAKLINMLNKQELKDKKKKMVILLWSVPAYTFNVIYTYFKSLGRRASEVRAFNRTSKKMFCNHRLMLFLMCPQGVESLRNSSENNRGKN